MPITVSTIGALLFVYSQQLSLKRSPLLTSNKQVPDVFYSKLQDVLSQIYAYDMVLVLGDMNVQVGNGSLGDEHCMGQHGTEGWTDNGERFL